VDVAAKDFCSQYSIHVGGVQGVAQQAAREPGQGRYLFPDSKLLRFFLDFVDGAFVLAVCDVARLIDRRIHLVGILRQQILHFVEQSHQIYPSSVSRTLSSGADFRRKRPQLPMNVLPCMATPCARCLALRAPIGYSAATVTVLPPTLRPRGSGLIDLRELIDHARTTLRQTALLDQHAVRRDGRELIIDDRESDSPPVEDEVQAAMMHWAPFVLIGGPPLVV
jgi:hypothetical protein